MVDRNRALTQDLQRERAERQRVQARLVAAESSSEGMEAESLRDAVAALEVSGVHIPVFHERSPLAA